MRSLAHLMHLPGSGRLAFLLVAALHTALPLHLAAQAVDSTAQQDTTAQLAPLPADSVQPTGASGVDTVVVYSAKDSVVFNAQTREMFLFEGGDLKYRTMELNADWIGINWNTATLSATGVTDTSDTTGQRQKGRPLLKDGGEEYHGSVVGYNFRSKKGRITLGDTEIDQGYYHGEQIKKVDKDVLFVQNGRYTTCDLEHPHFYFMSPKMKVILRDVVIAEPVYFYIADVPIFALPFGVFPNRSGRRSGLIAPAFGDDARLGRYLNHLGYYWAISDYMDLATTTDLYTRGGWAGHSLFRYSLRYYFSGSVAANITRRFSGEPGDPTRTETRDYNVRLTHNQQIDPTTNANVNFTFSSGSYYRNFSTNLDDVLRQNIVSNATLTKTWTESNSSLSAYIYRDQNLQSGDIQEQLPSLSFSQGTFFPFQRKGLSGAGGTSERPWYEMTGINYSASAANSRSKTSTKIYPVDQTTGLPDTLTEFARTSRQNLTQNASISVAPKLGHFTLSPSLSFRDERAFSDTRSPELSSLDTSLVFSTTRQRTGNGYLTASVGTGTRFYGIAQPNIFGVTAFRHTVNPTLSLAYSKQVYGQNMQKYSLTSNLSIQNVFEMKYQPSDSVKEQKIQLLNLGIGLSYNFAAAAQKLSEMSVSYRTNVGQVFSLSGSSSFNFYEYDPVQQRRVNRFLIKERGYLADMTRFSLSLSTSLRGEKKTKSQAGEVPQNVLQEQQRASGVLPDPGMAAETQSLFQQTEPDFSIPWNLNLIFNFSQSRPTPTQTSRSASLSAELSFNLTEKWKISARGNYDLSRKEFAAPSVVVSRDLHCWLMNFTWYPVGFLQGYRLEIRVKAPQLQDIKVTKQGGGFISRGG